MICVVQLFKRNDARCFLTAKDHSTFITFVQNVTTKNLGERIMKKTISISVFSKISLNFKGETHNVKMGRGGGGTLFR
jgi:hypothetical protein